MDHVALYGNTAIGKTTCGVCGVDAFVVDGKVQCCGSPVDFKPLAVKRYSSAGERRRKPPVFHRNRILREQDYRCLYCGRLFGSVVETPSRRILISVRWDHVDPYVYSQNNKPQNFAAACQICNGWKSSLSFQSLEEIRSYVGEKWSRLLRMPVVRESVSEEKTVAEVLQPAMSGPALEYPKPKTQDILEKPEGWRSGPSSPNWRITHGACHVGRLYSAPLDVPEHLFPVVATCLKCKCHYRIWDAYEWQWWKYHPECVRRHRGQWSWDQRRLKVVWSRIWFHQSPQLGRPPYLLPVEWVYGGGDGV